MKPEYIAAGLLGVGLCWVALELCKQNLIEEERLALEEKKLKQERLPRLIEATGNATGAALEGAGKGAEAVIRGAIQGSAC